MSEGRDGGRGLSRRDFLAGSGGLAAGVALGGLGTGLASDAPPERAAGFVPFHGPHQAGITALRSPAAHLAAAFTVVAQGRAGLRELLRSLTDETEGLMAGRPPGARDPAYPPVDSGLLGATPRPDDLSVVVSVGASLFDGRFGIGDRRPRELVRMPFLANDRLDPTRSHGDLLLTLAAGHPDTLQHALRQLMRHTRDALVLDWVLDGFNRRTQAGPGETGSPRNLLGFKDGTANLDPAREAQMRRHVWVGASDGEPAWAVGGSYQVVRVIRMLVEFWDRTSLAEQEAIIGRHKVSGAPLGGHRETEVPRYDDDPEGERTPLDAHIRLANPRTPRTSDQRILRRGFSYTRGYDRAGRLDQGLSFVCYQRSLRRGFLSVQGRLTGEPLEEYILPEGGGFYFALPGARAGEMLGEALVA